MKFKEPHMAVQYEKRHPRLKEVCRYFCELSMDFGVDPVVTRVTDTVEGESGVHPAGRAVDFRNEIRTEKGSVFLYPTAVAQEFVAKINGKFPRSDGKVVCLHHSFNGAPYHFHIQVPVEWVEKPHV